MSSKQAGSELPGLLGKHSDFHLAARFKRSPVEIRQMREAAKIAPVSAGYNRQAISWTPARDKLLGTMPDTALARRLQTSKQIVGYRRMHLGIACYERPALPQPSYIAGPHEWKAREDALLGTDYDKVIAARLGVTISQVIRRRWHLAIDAYKRSDRIVWTDEMLGYLGVVSDSEYASYYGISPLSTRLKRIALGIPTFAGHQSPVPELPAEVYDLLGVWTDVRIVEEYGLLRVNVRLVRMVMGIEPAQRHDRFHFDWDKQSDALLGTDSDTNIAAKLGITPQQVRYRRQQQGVLPSGYSDRVNWTRDKIAQLGKYSDKVLAGKFRCSPRVITKKRKALGITARHGARIWRKAEIALLGTDTDTEIAKQLGVSSSQIRRKRMEYDITAFRSNSEIRWTKKHLSLLGRINDQELAYRMKVNPATVSKKRIELGIERAEDHRQAWREKRNRELLGTMSDGAIARKLGVTPSAVRLKRVAMGIPAFVSSS